MALHFVDGQLPVLDQKAGSVVVLDHEEAALARGGDAISLFELLPAATAALPLSTTLPRWRSSLAAHRGVARMRNAAKSMGRLFIAVSPFFLNHFPLYPRCQINFYK